MLNINEINPPDLQTPCIIMIMRIIQDMLTSLKLRGIISNIQNKNVLFV